MDRLLAGIVLLFVGACGGSSSSAGGDAETASSTETSEDSTTSDTESTSTSSGMTGLWTLTGCTGTPGTGAGDFADVQEVSMSGSSGAYTVSVTVLSPDVDCEQYADWWEVVTPEGELVYRRILNHSHADEQPFTRASEGTVELTEGVVYRVRAHLHPSGYGGQVMEGEAGGSFSAVTVEDGWAADLETEAPLPQECWF